MRTILNSDHLPVFTTIHCGLRTKNQPCKQYVYRKTNWTKFRSHLNDHVINRLTDGPLLSEESIDKAVSELTLATKEAIHNCTPYEKVTRAGTLFSEELEQAIRLRNCYRRRFSRQHRHSDKEWRDYYDRLVKYLIARDEKLKYENLFKKAKTGDNQIYKIIRKMKRESIPPLQSSTTSPMMTLTREKCNLLADQFETMHINTMAKNDIFFTLGIQNATNQYIRGYTPNDDYCINARSLHDTIRNLKNGKAPGLDDVPVIAIKNY